MTENVDPVRDIILEDRWILLKRIAEALPISYESVFVLKKIPQTFFHYGPEFEEQPKQWKHSGFRDAKKFQNYLEHGRSITGAHYIEFLTKVLKKIWCKILIDFSQRI